MDFKEVRDLPVDVDSDYIINRFLKGSLILLVTFVLFILLGQGRVGSVPLLYHYLKKFL